MKNELFAGSTQENYFSVDGQLSKLLDLLNHESLTLSPTRKKRRQRSGSEIVPSESESESESEAEDKQSEDELEGTQMNAAESTLRTLEQNLHGILQRLLSDPHLGLTLHFF